MSLNPYLHLKQGHGGLYSMPHVSQDTNGTDQTLRWIGSRGCFTCVCIYIPLSQNEVFAAHIDSHTGEHNRPIDWVPETAEEAELLKAYIHKRLAEKLPFLANGEYASNPLRSKAIILCPRRELSLDGTLKMRATGWSVVEAVREFFRFTPDSRGTHFAHGFIVNHSTGERHFLKYQSDEANEDLQDRLDQLKHKEKDTMVPRDHEELQQLLYGGQQFRADIIHKGSGSRPHSAFAWCFAGNNSIDSLRGSWLSSSDTQREPEVSVYGSTIGQTGKAASVQVRLGNLRSWEQSRFHGHTHLLEFPRIAHHVRPRSLFFAKEAPLSRDCFECQ